MSKKDKLAILGAGNLGLAIARGLARVGSYAAEQITLTRRHLDPLQPAEAEGFKVQSDNRAATRAAKTVLIAVQPQQLDGVLEEIGPEIDAESQLLISVVSGADIASMRQHLPGKLPVLRAMPNVAAAVGQSMTCLAMDPGLDGSRVQASIDTGREIFKAVGSTLVIDEEQMQAATALCACGVAFFLRALRAASQGGIEIGFHPEEALAMSAQTALGAAALIVETGRHPEREIDTVTTPRGCTIAGLNEMEHRGFSSAMIRGILLASEKASGLYAGQSEQEASDGV
ncbi:MAG: pyrroline-5-carboxylate reductase [Planctomycetota bacterium]|jgi:pyrroline-5-carboxylate reductase